MLESTVIPLLRARLAELTALHENLEAARKEISLEYHGELEQMVQRLQEQVRTAGEKYTICVIGEFKVGKSTFINSLLGLSGENALSAADSSDTACSIMLRHRGPEDAEAVLIFDDKSNIPPQSTSWEKAKRLTSQFYRNSHPEAAQQAKSLVRVDYYLNHPLLVSFQLNDLPGTGTSYWKTHTKIAEESMRTADTIVWLVFDQEPGSDGTQFINIVLRESRRILPVMNVRQEPGDRPETDVAEEIANTITRRYRQHFEEDIKRPMFYAARAMEVEAAKEERDLNVLKSGGYSALMERLFFSEVSSQRTEYREQRVCGSSRALFLETRTRILHEQDLIVGMLEQTEQARKSYVRRIQALGDTQGSIIGQLSLIAEAYVYAVTEAVAESAESFIEDKLRITNWESVKAFFNKASGTVTKEWDTEFEASHLQTNRRLERIEEDAEEKARATLLNLWRAQDELLDPVLQAQIAAPRKFSVLKGTDFDRGVGFGILQTLGGIALISLIFAFPLGILVSGGFADMVTVNPMEKVRREALARTRRTIRTACYTLQDEFLSAWKKESSKIHSELQAKVEAEQGNAQKKLATILALKQQMEQEAAMLQEEANWLYSMQTEGRSL